MKQPRVPEYRESDGVKAYIKPLILFLKDFTMAAWTANNQRKKEIENVYKQMPEMPEVIYPVTSVNGKKGDVQLKASDVGALGVQEQAADAGRLGGMLPSAFAPAAQAVPAGGAAGQALFKKTDGDHDVQWKDLPEGVQMNLLWENASPTSSFAAQTIPASALAAQLSAEDYIQIDHVHATVAGKFLSERVRVGESTYLGKGYLYHASGLGVVKNIMTRSVTVATNGITFGDALLTQYYDGYWHDYTSQNIECVPIAIYLIKGA